MEASIVSSALELAGRIRRRELSSEAVVAAHVERARRHNPALNAIVCDRYDDALADARAADERVRREAPEALPPLLGVPCTIKECFAFTGMPQSSGLVSRRELRATSDAPAVARLRAAGAIPLGVTNLSELCMWMESSNKVYGRTVNPYDASCTAGGSSGGEGASVGAGLAPFGLGSDVGGSIRMPAFFCGVFGHKPTQGWIPNEGQYPIAEGDAQSMLTTGPLARRAEDLWPLLEVLAGRSLGPGPAAVDVSSLVVLDCEGNGLFGVSSELRAAQERALSMLSRRGAKVRTFSSPRLRRSLEIWASRMGSGEGRSFGELMGDGRALSPGRELVRWLLGRSNHTLPAVGLAVAEAVATRVGLRTSKMRGEAAALRGEIEAALGPTGVLLFPSYTRTAPRHGTPLLFPVQWVYTAIINAIELPATQVPLGLGARDLPLGVQVVTSQGSDRLSVAAALALEEETGGWTPPGRLV